MEKKSQRQPEGTPQSVDPVAALHHYERRITTYINLLQNFQDRKKLTDKTLQKYIDELNKLTVEISNLAMCLSRTESRKFTNLLRHIYGVIRKFDSAKQAYLRKNNHKAHIDEALIKLHNAKSECRYLLGFFNRKQ